MKRLRLVAFYVAYGFVYLGFVLHRSDRPWLLSYSARHLYALAVLALPFAAPPLARALRRRFAMGSKHLVFSLAPALALFGAFYLVAMVRYYYQQQHPFDPYVQVPPVRLPRPIPPRDARTLRILMLGGSTTECPELSMEDKYPTVLSRLLSARHPDRTIEVLNAGRTWYTTRHSLVNYVTYYQEWEPDVVVVMHTLNDVTRSFSPDPFAWGPYNELYAHYYGAAYSAARPTTFEAYLRRQLAPLPLWSYWYSEIFPPYRIVDYPVDRYVSRPDFERNLRFLARAVRATGSRLVLVTEPSLYKAQMSRDELQTLWFARNLCNTPRGFGRFDIPSPQSLKEAMTVFNGVVKAVAAEERTGLVDADAALDKSLANFLDDCHYTPAGARRLAELMADALPNAPLAARE